MIVNKSVVGIHIIFHETHGLLAGKIANEILEAYRPIHWFETLIAVVEHDDRQLNFKEKEYLSDIGVPLDFTEERNSVYEIIKRMKRILKVAQNKSLWVKLLISYHLEFIYSHIRAESKLVSTFFKDMETMRQSILQVYNVSDKQARNYYEFLRFCDRLSLILCKDETPAAERLLEINTSINGTTYFIKKKDHVLEIEPWIFKSTEFQLEIEERILKQTQFSSSKKFESELLACKPQLKKWCLRKPN